MNAPLPTPPATAPSRLRRFWRDYVHRYRFHYLAGVLFLVATNYLTVAVPGFVQRAVDALAKERDPDRLQAAVGWAWAILATGAGIVVVRTLSRILFFNPGRTLEFEVKNALFDHLLALPRRFYDRMRGGEIISRGTNDVNWLRALAGYSTLQVFNVVLILAFTLGKMAWADWRLTLWCVLPLVGAAAVMRKAVAAMFRLTQRMQAELAVLSDRILEAYNGVGVLQAFSAVSGAVDRFDESNRRLEEVALHLNRIRSWALPVVSVVGNLCIVIVLYVGGLRVIAGQLTLGELAAFTVYINILVGALMSFGFMINAVQRGVISLDRVYEVLDAPLERPSVRAALPPPGTRGPILEVSGLSFRHEGAATPALQDVSFRLTPGETVGVFGPTGAGKSTLLQVLARVYDPPPGAVRLDGLDVLDVDVAELYRRLAYVPQEAWLFSASLRENVALSERGERPDEARLLAAVEDAALADDVGALPQGLDTPVGERGITLSGGQRQRAALARAFYREYDLLLLDDVMSAVDHATEKRLIEAVYRRGRAATTLIVSHRCSVLARAERILVLDEGRLVDSGTHAELAARPGPYARAWALQQAAEAIEHGAEARA